MFEIETQEYSKANLERLAFYKVGFLFGRTSKRR